MMFRSKKREACGYCGAPKKPRDPHHVHGCNECLCGEFPVHNLYLHLNRRRRAWRSFAIVVVLWIVYGLLVVFNVFERLRWL